MKNCSRCQVALPTDYTFAWCKTCRKECDKERHQKNKGTILIQKKAWKRKQREAFEAFKATLACVVCGETASECLDFHHLDPTQKEQTIANLASRRSVEGLQKELDKCVVLCSNCHRKVHSGRITI